MPSPTIAVFDSGFGGLTVLRELLPLIPGANYIYLGDTARLPYGAKSRQTIVRYALSSAAFLLSQGAEMLVVACNTASALALDELRAALPIPVVGVIEPGVQAALAAQTAGHPERSSAHLPNAVEGPPQTSPNLNSPDLFPTVQAALDAQTAGHPERSSAYLPNAVEGPPQTSPNLNSPDLFPTVQAALDAQTAGHPERSSAHLPNAVEGPPQTSPNLNPRDLPPTVLVLATAATVQSHAYAQACAALNLTAYEKACPLLVPLVEEGWTDHPVTAEVLRIYLTEALAAAPTVTTLVLGCTHYPLIKPLIERTLATLNHPLQIVDSATATAQAAHREKNCHPSQSGCHPSRSGGSAFAAPTTTFYATDSIEKFQRLGSAFLGQPLPEVHLIDLGG